MGKSSLAVLKILVLMLLFILSSCANMKQEHDLKIGIIDSSISEEVNDRYKIQEKNSLLKENTQNDISHGEITLEIISNQVPTADIYYVEVLSESLKGDIENVVKGIEWCIEKKVDMICMSFATIKDDEELKNVVQRAIEAGIDVVAATVNYSDVVCYPAMYDGVISVSVGFNKNATLIFENVPLKVKAGNKKLELKGTSVYTAYACGKIAKENLNIKWVLQA